MRSLLLTLVWICGWTLCCTSCTVIKHPSAGTYATLGGDTTALQADAAGFTFASNNNSLAFQETAKLIRQMWNAYLMARGLEFLGGKYYDQQNAELSSNTTLKLEELRTAETVKLAEIKLEELKAMEALAAP